MLEKLGKAGQVETYRTTDGRLIGLYISGNFADYVSFPPLVHTLEEQADLAEAYKAISPQRARETKAHVTANELPLQIEILNRDPGTYVRPHYHLNDMPAVSQTRHQILLCQFGRLRVGLYTIEGVRIGHVMLQPGDLMLMCEGHSLEFLDPETKIIEIKMGPFSGSDVADKVDLNVDREPVSSDT